ncbi:hypothetical protein IB229_20820 [Pseudomonas sp. PDM14]|uniref:hypothetical protein n=1 Tax=Pseudomonas sp. PDM14 TaxID=2769288 RepID=UPI0017863EC3|nr:hypothetical protein [Pseudomonas sp. PDM14]MBD9485430.1 hypothetical protein [Pseudomonas sp. PDM14]
MDFFHRACVRGPKACPAQVSLLFAAMLAATGVQADCVLPLGSTTVTCSTAASGLAPFSSTKDNLTATVNNGAGASALLGLLGTAMTMTGNNVTLHNAGVINPSLLGLSVLNNGVVIGNSNASTVTVNNLSTGVINGTTGVAVDLLNLSGFALRVQNGAGGVTNINNAGIIGSNVLANVTVLQADTPQVAVYGGG